MTQILLLYLVAGFSWVLMFSGEEEDRRERFIVALIWPVFPAALLLLAVDKWLSSDQVDEADWASTDAGSGDGPVRCATPALQMAQYIEARDKQTEFQIADYRAPSGMAHIRTAAIIGDQGARVVMQTCVPGFGQSIDGQEPGRWLELDKRHCAIAMARLLEERSCGDHRAFDEVLDWLKERGIPHRTSLDDTPESIEGR